MYFENEKLDSINADKELEITLRGMLGQDESRNTSENIQQSPHTSKFPKRHLLLYLFSLVSIVPSSLLTNLARLAISSCTLSNISAETMAG